MSEAEQHFKGIGKLVEECGEVLQLCGKAMLFPVGPHPDGKGPIAERLPAELSERKAAIIYFESVNNLTVDNERVSHKVSLFERWGLAGVFDLMQKPYGK